MPNTALLATILCGTLLGFATADATCSSMGGCPQISNDQSILLQSRVLMSSDGVEKQGEPKHKLLDFEQVGNKEKGKLLDDELHDSFEKDVEDEDDEDNGDHADTERAGEGSEQEKPRDASFAARKNTITVNCKFSLMEQDNNDDTGEALTYGMCEDGNGVVHYIRDDSQSEELNSGAMVALELEEIQPGTDQGPWKAEGKPFYRVVEEGASLLASAEEVAAKNRAKYGLQQEGVKQVGFLMVLLNYTDTDLLFTDLPAKIPMTEDLIWKGTYSKPEDWSTDPDGNLIDPVLKAAFSAKPDWKWYEKRRLQRGQLRIRGSFGDALEKSSGGRLSAPESRGRVVTVQMGKTWAEEVCSFVAIGKSALSMAKDQFPGLDPGAYDFREIFMPGGARKKECKGLITGWNHVRAGVAAFGCGHPSLLPNPGGCMAWYSGGDTFVRSHELGHNLGLLHNMWLWPDGTKRYLDPESWNGGAEVLLDATAADRHQMGLLEDKEGEVLYWRDQNVAPVTMSSISHPVDATGEGFMAIRWPCPACTPSVVKDQVPGAGFLFLQFRGNSSYSALNTEEKYHNKAYVHFQPGQKRKRYGTGTELRAILDIKSPAYSPKDSPYHVHLCALGNDFVKVSLGATPSEAEKRCSQDAANVFYPAPTPAPTPPPPTLEPTLFTKHAGKTCGWRNGCKGGNHVLNIGANGKNWDRAEPDRTAYICGTKCIASAQCGGFVYNRRSKKCSYRKLATCGVKANRVRDCYVRNGFIAPTPAPPPPPPTVSGFTTHAGKTCGWRNGCKGDNHRLNIGANGRNWDRAQPDQTSSVCGTKCTASAQCGGFIYDRKSKKCKYRKLATCGMKANTKRDCYVRKGFVAPNL